ncbi:hypothetical protein V1505DRAFT_286873, partial [Lipomyces doorenjongii]
MSSESTLFQCAQCSHPSFDTRAKLSKHVSSKHRTTDTFSFSGMAYPLIITDDGKYACPTCMAGASTISNLRRHMDQNCSRTQEANGAHGIDDGQHDEDSGHGTMDTEVSAMHGTISVEDCASLGGIGFSFNPEWNVLTCNYCRHIVDKSMLKQHLTMVHKLTIQDEGAMWQTIRSHRIRAHLVVVWDERTERELDDSDDEHAGRTGYASIAFRPGAAAVEGVAVVDGYKCVLCENGLQHRCVQSKEAMRTHYRRQHPSQVVDFCSVRVQAFYGRS